MRLSILGLNYSPEPTGNAPYTTGLAENRAARGDQVEVLCSFPHYPQWQRYDGYQGWTRRETLNGVRVTRLKHWIPNPPRGVKRLVSELTFGWRTVTRRWGKPDAVVVVSPALFSSAMAMARLRLSRVPRVVMWVQDLYGQGMSETGEGGSFAVKIATAVEGWTLRSADRVVAIHPTMAQRMIDTLGVPPHKVTTITNWSHITPSTLTKQEARRHLGWDERALIALHAGNMGAKQGLEVAIEAARLAGSDSPFTITLVGDGSERERLKARAADVPNVRFVDPVSSADFPIMLAAADVLLVTEVPGVAEMAVPSKLTSYFAAGRPVIASVSATGIVAGIMTTAGAGTCTPAGDAQALAQALSAMANNAGWCDESGQHAQQFWKNTMRPEAAFEAWQQVLTDRPESDARTVTHSNSV